MVSEIKSCLSMNQDIPWQQRFSNYSKALKKLSSAIDIIGSKNISSSIDILSNIDKGSKDAIEDVLKEGLIQRFEYTYELAWNVMKDFAEFQGMTNIAGSRDATREAFKMGLIADGDNWMAMLESRKLTSHSYNSDTANEIFVLIVTKYYKLFLDFETKMASLNEGSSGNSLKQQ